MILDLATSRSFRDVFAGWIRLCACGLSLGTREDEYREEAKRWAKQELETMSEAFGHLVKEMEAHPLTDLVGASYIEAEGEVSKSMRGEFYTPEHICRFMGQMLAGEPPPTGEIWMAEPSCGSGAMILGYASAMKPEDRLRLRVDATDINRVACDVCFINLSLNWIAGRVTHGNTLSGDVWGRWFTTPVLLVPAGLN